MKDSSENGSGTWGILWGTLARAANDGEVGPSLDGPATGLVGSFETPSIRVLPLQAIRAMDALKDFLRHPHAAVTHIKCPPEESTIKAFRGDQGFKSICKLLSCERSYVPIFLDSISDVRGSRSGNTWLKRRSPGRLPVLPLGDGEGALSIRWEVPQSVPGLTPQIERGDRSVQA